MACVPLAEDLKCDRAHTRFHSLGKRKSPERNRAHQEPPHAALAAQFQHMQPQICSLLVSHKPLVHLSQRRGALVEYRPLQIPTPVCRRLALRHTRLTASLKIKEPGALAQEPQSRLAQPHVRPRTHTKHSRTAYAPAPAAPSRNGKDNAPLQ